MMPLIKQFGTTNPAKKFAEYYAIPQWVADYMFDYAWFLNKQRKYVHTKGISPWIRGGYGRDQYAIDVQWVATLYVKEVIDAAKSS